FQTFTASDVGEGAVALVASANLPALRALGLPHNRLGDDLVARMARLPRLARLTGLDLDSNALTDEAAAALSESPYAAGLIALGLQGNRIGAAGVRALAGSRHLSRDLVIRVDLFGIDADTRAALRRRFPRTNCGPPEGT